jgi:hypothetical protein
MSDSLQFHSRVGDDGVLNLQVNLGQTEAKKEVVVTIAPAPKPPITAEDDPHALSWHDFLERTYGSCAGHGLDRPEQLPWTERDSIE